MNSVKSRDLRVVDTLDNIITDAGDVVVFNVFQIEVAPASGLVQVALVDVLVTSIRQSLIG